MSKIASDDVIKKLERDYATLVEKRDQLEAEMGRVVEERDKFNERVRALRASASEFRSRRDEVNQRIQELRSQGRGLREEMEEKRRALQELDERLQEARINIGEDRKKVEARLRRLDWEMSTTPTREMMKREEQVVKEIRDLRSQLAAYDDIGVLEARRLELRTELAALRLRNRDASEPIEALKSESDVNHQKMIDELKRVDEMRLQADEAHEKVVETRNQLRQMAGEAVATRAELQRLLREREMAKASRVKEEAVQRIREKLSKGGRLTFEEFKLLSQMDEKEEPSANPMEES